MPRLDHQLVAGLVQVSEDCLGNLDPPAPAAGDRRVREVDLDGAPGELRLAGPSRWMRWRRILGGTVERQPRIALEIAQLEGVRHHAEQELAVREFHLDAADPG